MSLLDYISANPSNASSAVNENIRRLNQEKFMAASDLIDRLEVTPRDLGLEASVAHDKALRRLFARYYGRLSAEHTRVQIQVIETISYV